MEILWLCFFDENFFKILYLCFIFIQKTAELVLKNFHNSEVLGDYFLGLVEISWLWFFNKTFFKILYLCSLFTQKNSRAGSKNLP